MVMLAHEAVQSAQGSVEESAHDSTPQRAQHQELFASTFKLRLPGSNLLQGRKMRKSCDFCFKRRKKCDGDGVSRCRYRMTASAATGLVGTKENVLLREFFNCLGYVSLTTPSDIREAMIKVMSSRKQYQTIGTGDVVGCDMTSAPWSEDSHQGTTQLVTTRGCPNALVCIFWCALALGGLLQGQPESSVARYVQFAEDALTLCEGKTGAETARALGIMSVLYGFLERDQEDVMACLEQRVRMMESLEDDDSKQIMREGFKFFAQNQMSEEDLRGSLSEASDVFSIAGSSPRESTLKMVELSDEALYAQVAQLGSSMMMFIIRADANKASPEREPGTSSQCFDGTGASPGSSDDLSESYGPNAELGPARYAPLRRFLFGNAAWIELLRRGAKRHSLQWGLAIELQGIISLVSAAMGNKEAVIESAYYCAETFIRYPGLGRFVGRHLHFVITTLVIAVVGDHATYDQLAVSFNALRLQGMPSVPPLEERLGRFLNGHILCRIAENFLREHGWGAVSGLDASDDIPQASYEEELMVSPDSYEGDTHTSVASCDDPDSSASLCAEPTSSCPTEGYLAKELVKKEKADKTDKTDQLWDTIDASDWDDVAASLSASSQNSSDVSLAEIMSPNSHGTFQGARHLQKPRPLPEGPVRIYLP